MFTPLGEQISTVVYQCVTAEAAAKHGRVRAGLGGWGGGARRDETILFPWSFKVSMFTITGSQNSFPPRTIVPPAVNPTTSHPSFASFTSSPLQITTPYHVRWCIIIVQKQIEHKSIKGNLITSFDKSITDALHVPSPMCHVNDCLVGRLYLTLRKEQRRGWDGRVT